tara:strand:- start:106 stop:444 length:339 start_codon:yes stop_codon:yes gene_type:complete
MSLDLNHIHYVINNNKFTSRGWNTGRRSLPRSAEEIFQLSHLAPATHAYQCRNTYRLDLNVNLDGCCSAVPDISVPLTIIPLTCNMSEGFIEPVDYHPTELGYFKFDLQWMR